MVFSSSNDPLVMRNTNGWVVPGVLLRPLLASLRIQEIPQTGKQFTEVIARYLGCNLANRTIIEVADGRRDLAAYIKYDYHRRLARLIQGYRVFRDQHPTHAVVIDVRVADAMRSVATIIDAYVAQEIGRSEYAAGSFDNVNKRAYAFVFGLQRNSTQALDFKTLKYLVSTGRCDGIEFLGRSCLKSSLKRLFQLRPGLVYGEIVAVLRSFIEDNFSSRLGGFLLTECSHGVKNLLRRHTKLGDAAASELAKMFGALGQRCEALVLKANSNSRFGGAAARFFANLICSVPADEQNSARTMLFAKGSGAVIAECLLAVPWLFESSMLTSKIPLIANALADLIGDNCPGLDSSDNPRAISRRAGIIPANGPVRALVVALHPTIIDKIWPHVIHAVVQTKGPAALCYLLGLRLQAERATGVGVDEGRLFVTSLIRGLGLFDPRSSGRHRSDLALLGKVIECGDVQEVAEVFNGLAIYLSPPACRDIAKIYVGDEHAMVSDLRTILNSCLKLGGLVTVDHSKARNITDVIAIFDKLGK